MPVNEGEKMLHVLRKALMVSLAAAMGVGVVAAVAAAGPGNSPAITFLSSSPAAGSTLTTDNPAFAFEYNRKPNATKSLTCALKGPSGTTSGACDTPTAGGAGSRSGKSYPELDDGSYTFTVSLRLTDGGVATASRSFVVAEGACDVENGTTKAENNDLSAAITAASAGDVLKIEGTCVGNFLIKKNLTLTGPSALDHATLDGNATGNAVQITSGASVSLQHLRITNGLSVGGIQVNQSTLDAVDIDVSGNDGGGILVFQGSVTLTRSKISNNITGDGGGILALESNLFLDGTTIADNCACGDYDGGGGIFTAAGNLTFSGAPSSITGNTAPDAEGGGVLIYRGIEDSIPPTNVTVTTTPTISGNTPDNCFPLALAFAGCA